MTPKKYSDILAQQSATGGTCANCGAFSDAEWNAAKTKTKEENNILKEYEKSVSKPRRFTKEKTTNVCIMHCS